MLQNLFLQLNDIISSKQQSKVHLVQDPEDFKHTEHTGVWNYYKIECA